MYCFDFVSINVHFSWLSSLTLKWENGIMSELHKCINTDNNNVESKEGEQRRLCSNNVGNCSPSLEYYYTNSSERLDKAFDILFDEVIKNFEVTLWNQEK